MDMEKYTNKIFEAKNFKINVVSKQRNSKAT